MIVYGLGRGVLEKTKQITEFMCLMHKTVLHYLILILNADSSVLITRSILRTKWLSGKDYWERSGYQI